MQKSTVRIPHPCAEGWDLMSPREKGRHCTVCQKTVVDFSQCTTDGIVAYFAQGDTAGVCGRFRAAQLRQSARLLTWRAAPQIALSLVAVLTLMRCTVDTTDTVPVKAGLVLTGDEHVISGVVLDREGRQPLAGALIVCESDTLCQTRTAADGSFKLAVPQRLRGSKFIAAVPDATQTASSEEPLMPYMPHYFQAGSAVTVLLRRPPMILGQTKLEEGETRTPAIAPYLARQGVGPVAPPPPKLTTIKFIPPAATEHH